jgi:hypothetical protein
MKKIVILFVLASLLSGSGAFAQLPVEVVAGNKKASFDLMFFKFFKNKEEQNSKFLFFSRTRSTVDYKMTSTSYLPAFGLTEAVSYNHPALKGFAPVAVAQLLNRGVFPKAGIQYAHQQQHFTVFTWMVSETLKAPALDYFLLLRYTPKLNARLNLYTQFESNNSVPTKAAANYSFIQRLRIGLMIKRFQFGAAADFTQTGNKTFTTASNIGGFVRYEF